MMVDYRMETRKRHGLGRILFLGILIIAGVYLVKSLLNRSQTVVSPVPDEPRVVFSPLSIFQKKKSPDELKQKVKDAVGDTWVNYSVYVVSFNTNFVMGIGESTIYTAASVIKVPIMAALYYQAANGNADLDKKITIQPADVQDYGTGSIRYDPPGSVYSIRTLAKLLGQKSDNTAGYVLSNHVVGVKTITELIKQWGLIQTDIVNNKTSNSDMAVLFEKIINDKIATGGLTAEMLSFLSDSDFEERLPALLPDTVKVYHKIGNEIGNVHDVGVVVDGKRRYYIGVLTADVVNEEEAKALIAKISKLVYDYLR